MAPHVLIMEFKAPLEGRSIHFLICMQYLLFPDNKIEQWDSIKDSNAQHKETLKFKGL